MIFLPVYLAFAADGLIQCTIFVSDKIRLRQNVKKKIDFIAPFFLCLSVALIGYNAKLNLVFKDILFSNRTRDLILHLHDQLQEKDLVVYPGHPGVGLQFYWRLFRFDPVFLAAPSDGSLPKRVFLFSPEDELEQNELAITAFDFKTSFKMKPVVFNELDRLRLYLYENHF